MLALVKADDKTPYADALSARWKQIDEWRDRYGLYTKPRYRTDGEAIMPQDVIRTLHEVTKGDAYITSAVGQHQMFAAQYYLFDKPNRWINSGGMGTIGFGLPAAMVLLIAVRH